MNGYVIFVSADLPDTKSDKSANEGLKIGREYVGRQYHACKLSVARNTIVE